MSPFKLLATFLIITSFFQFVKTFFNPTVEKSKYALFPVTSLLNFDAIPVMNR